MKKKETIFDAIRNHQSFFIVGHYHPDGDALGSCLALGLGLEALKKEVVIYNQDPVPYNLSFLPNSDKITRRFPGKSFDVAVMIDCAQPKRVSPEFEAAVGDKKYKKLVCIDHHLLDHPVGDIDWIEPEAASAGSVVWELLKKLNIPLTQEMANLIYTTLTVDTGSFRYPNTTSSVLRLAAELVDLGADPWFVAQNIGENDPLERYVLLGLCLQSLQVGLKGHYASMEVTQPMLKKVGGNADLSEEFANIPRSIRGVEVAALFREEKDGKIKVSLRSKEAVDVAKIAKQFGGGGHEHAAGCNFKTGLVDAKKQVQQAIQKAFKI